MTIRYDDKVALVTGAGGGLGRSHAIELAKRGAKVVVNDLGGSVSGEGANSQASLDVVAEIEALGGEAMAHGANVADLEQVQDMVAQTMDRWGRLDILVNNAGILRDKSFSKGSVEDFRLVTDVHLMGTVHCTKSVLGHYERAGIRPHCGDLFLQRALWQLRANQLRCREDGCRRHDEYAGARGRQVQRQNQCAGADCGHTDDRGPH